MSGALQAVFQNQRSFGTPVPSAIGVAYGGGYYAGQISTTGDSVATHYIVVGPVASAVSANIQYKTSNSGSDPTSAIDGPANSAAVNTSEYPAAYFCEGLTIGGFSDWYLPAVNELQVCYFNLKPGTGNNNTSSGINANAVPAETSNYTTGAPSQTSVSDFQTGGAQAFNPVDNSGRYWTSTTSGTSLCRYVSFTNGRNATYGKADNVFCRAIRRVAV